MSEREKKITKPRNPAGNCLFKRKKSITCVKYSQTDDFIPIMLGGGGRLGTETHQQPQDRLSAAYVRLSRYGNIKIACKKVWLLKGWARKEFSLPFTVQMSILIMSCLRTNPVRSICHVFVERVWYLKPESVEYDAHRDELRHLLSPELVSRSVVDAIRMSS